MEREWETEEKKREKKEKKKRLRAWVTWNYLATVWSFCDFLWRLSLKLDHQRFADAIQFLSNSSWICVAVGGVVVKKRREEFLHYENGNLRQQKHCYKVIACAANVSFTVCWVVDFDSDLNVSSLFTSFWLSALVEMEKEFGDESWIRLSLGHLCGTLWIFLLYFSGIWLSFTCHAQNDYIRFM